MMNIKKYDKGFSLIELIIAMAISTTVLSGIIAVFHKQVVSHNTERLMVAMQQNVRAAASFMERDIRLARYDETGSGLFTIGTANRARLQFLSDFENPDGAVSDRENITYALDNDANGDGIADGTPCNLVRIINIGGGTQTDIVARNIDALNFEYFDTSVTPANPLIDNTATPWQVPVDDIADIRSVRVSIVARAGNTIPVGFTRVTDTTQYRNRSGDIIFGPANDVFRRMQVTTEIDCRN